MEITKEKLAQLATPKNVDQQSFVVRAGVDQKYKDAKRLRNQKLDPLNPSKWKSQIGENYRTAQHT